MKSILVVLLLGLYLVFLVPGPAQADNPPPNLANVRFDQNLNAQVPGNLSFTDDYGDEVTLGQYFGSKPTILTLNYYHCPNLCSLELDQLAGNLADLSWTLGDQYQVVTVSIDPRETVDLAAESKWERLRAYARANTGPGWHFLIGDQTSIDHLAKAVGFHYVYDASLDEYEHPTGIMVLTPQGRVSRYIYGDDYRANDIKLALLDASGGKIGSPVEQLLLYCYQYDPAQGRYSLAIFRGVQVAGIATVLVLGGFLFVMFRHDLRKDREWLDREPH